MSKERTLEKEIFAETAKMHEEAEDNANGLADNLVIRTEKLLNARLPDQVKRDVSTTMYESIHSGIATALSFAINCKEIGNRITMKGRKH